MKILLIDDHAMVRDGLNHVLHQLECELVVVEAGSCGETMQILPQHPDIDLVLLDLDLPDSHDFSCLEKIGEYDMSLPVVILSGELNKEVVMEALGRGALGYISKSSSTEVMLAAIQLVLAGEIYIPSFTLERNFGSSEQVKNSSKLTNRQNEVLALMAKGYSNKEISKQLGMSAGTVRIHVSAILQVLNVKNRAEAVTRAYQLKLLQ